MHIPGEFGRSLQGRGKRTVQVRLCMDRAAASQCLDPADVPVLLALPPSSVQGHYQPSADRSGSPVWPCSLRRPIRPHLLQTDCNMASSRSSNLRCNLQVPLLGLQSIAQWCLNEGEYGQSQNFATSPVGLACSDSIGCGQCGSNSGALEQLPSRHNLTCIAVYMWICAIIHLTLRVTEF